MDNLHKHRISQKEMDFMKEVVNKYSKYRISVLEKKDILAAYRSTFNTSNRTNAAIIQMFYTTKREIAPEKAYNRTVHIAPEKIAFMRKCVDAVGEENLNRMKSDEIVMKFKINFPDTKRSLAAIYAMIKRLPMYEKMLKEKSEKKQINKSTLNEGLRKELVDLKELIESIMDDFIDATGRVIEVIGLALKEQQSNK